MRLLTTFIMGLLFFAHTNAQDLNVQIQWIENDCSLMDSLIANVIGGQGGQGTILGEYDYVTFDHFCGTAGDTLTGSVEIIEKLDESLAFTDFSFGLWTACYNIDAPTGSLNFNLVDNMITPLNGTDNYGDVWMFDAFTYNNNSYMITFSNTYGEFGTVILTPSDGRLIPDLSGDTGGGTGGNPTYNYQWNTGETTQVITFGLSQGIYEVTVTDDNGNSGTDLFFLSPNHPDEEFLRQFYMNSDGDNWVDNTGWKEWMDGNPICEPCDWVGVDCGGGNRVRGISLPENNLTGNIEDLITVFPLIEQIALERNNISGQLPDDIDQRAFNVISLAGNNISGPIPESIGNLPLFFLNLSVNNFSGEIPSTLNENPFIVVLNLDFNELSGSIPENFTEITASVISLSGNNLTGEVPMPFGSVRLRYMDLSRNELTGPVEDLWSDYERLDYVNLSENMLSGEIPSSLLNVETIEDLYLNDNNFSGCYPTEKSLLPCDIGFNDNQILVEIKGEPVAFFDGDGYNFINNPLLPWEGDYEKFCNGEDQVGAPCDDGNAMTINDVINEDCSCAGEIDSAVRDLHGISLNIYPNPISSVLFVETDQGKNIRAELVNLLGQHIKHIKMNEANDIQDLGSGTYFLRMENEQGEFIVEKLIKQ